MGCCNGRYSSRRKSEGGLARSSTPTCTSGRKQDRGIRFRIRTSPTSRIRPHDGTLEMLIADMDQHGCTHCGAGAGDLSRLGQRLRRRLRRSEYPDRLKAHGLIDPTDPKVADKLEFWIKEHGLAGMRFSPLYYADGKHGGDAWLNADETHRAVEEGGGAAARSSISSSRRQQLPKLEKMVSGPSRTCGSSSTTSASSTWARPIRSRTSACCWEWPSIRTCGSRSRS